MELYILTKYQSIKAEPNKENPTLIEGITNTTKKLF